MMGQHQPHEGEDSQAYERKLREQIDNFPPYPLPPGSPYTAPARLWLHWLAKPENLRLALYGGVIVFGVIVVAEVFGHESAASAGEIKLDGQPSVSRLALARWEFDVPVPQEQAAESITELVAQPTRTEPSTLAVDPGVASVTVVGDVKRQYVPRHAVADIVTTVFDLLDAIRL